MITLQVHTRASPYDISIVSMVHDNLYDIVYMSKQHENKGKKHHKQGLPISW